MPAPSLTQSHVRYPLTTILGSTGNVRALRVLVNDRAPQSAPSVAQQAGLSPQGARLVLDTLARQQLVKVHGSGRTELYEFSAAHPFGDALVTLFQVERTRWENLLAMVRKTLTRHGAAVHAAWLYGSVARGEDTPRSDIDIALLVSSQELADEVREELTSLADEQQVHFSVTALTPKDLAAIPDHDRWWSDVVRDARILKGPAPDAAKRKVAKVAA
jgi:predicted nucleotidyltransferase